MICPLAQASAWLAQQLRNLRASCNPLIPTKQHHLPTPCRLHGRSSPSIRGPPGPNIRDVCPSLRSQRHALWCRAQRSRRTACALVQRAAARAGWPRCPCPSRARRCFLGPLGSLCCRRAGCCTTTAAAAAAAAAAAGAPGVCACANPGAAAPCVLLRPVRRCVTSRCLRSGCAAVRGWWWHQLPGTTAAAGRKRAASVGDVFQRGDGARACGWHAAGLQRTSRLHHPCPATATAVRAVRAATAAAAAACGGVCWVLQLCALPLACAS